MVHCGIVLSFLQKDSWFSCHLLASWPLPNALMPSPKQTNKTNKQIKRETYAVDEIEKKSYIVGETFHCGIVVSFAQNDAHFSVMNLNPRSNKQTKHKIYNKNIWKSAHRWNGPLWHGSKLHAKRFMVQLPRARSLFCHGSMRKWKFCQAPNQTNKETNKHKQY